MNDVTVENVTIAYNAAVAVNNVSFEVEQGDYCCIVGNNGSGKTTLLKAILGLIPVQSGCITPHLPKEDMAYIAQSTAIAPDFPANAFEIVLTGTQKKARRLPFYSKTDVEKAKSAMAQIGIADLEKVRIGHLSGGQQQRVLLARAMCREPKLLILDEPCAGLDERISESFYACLHDLNKHKGIGILMVSHDLDKVSQYAKHVLELNRSVTFFGSAADWHGARKGGDY